MSIPYSHKRQVSSRAAEDVELTDILLELDQRIHGYKNQLQELEKQRCRLDAEIAPIKKYRDLASPGTP